MAPDQTEFEWSYTPADFLEEKYERTDSAQRFVFERGRVVVTVDGARPSADAEVQLAKTVRTIMRARSMQIRRTFELEETPRITEFRGEKRHITMLAGVGAVGIAGDLIGVKITGPGGQVVVDTKAERIARHRAELTELSAKAAQSPVLDAMLASYAESIDHPEDELTHLYEIRDALQTQFAGADAAKTALGITSREWSDFGRLANDEPLLEGRHRGKHDNLRHATPEELERVRTLARDWIEKFAAAI